MKYHELTLRAKKSRRQVGRGIAAGRGKTAGRGTKGQGSRKSGNVRAGFEGGQTPLYMRIPKLRGFKSHRPKAEFVTVGQLEVIKKSVIATDDLFEAGLIASPFSQVKLLAGGQLNSKKEIRLPAASAGALEALKKSSSSFSVTKRLARPKAQKDNA